MQRQILFCSLAFAAAMLSAARAEVVVGAIPGSFSVSLSGSSSYSIPIKVAPGAAGTQPQVLLGYDSQSVGGPLGPGWSIGGFSVITRGPRDVFVDGAPGGINFDDNDALYLDGQRLIEVAPPPNRLPGATYFRKVNDDYTEVVRYGTSLERSYFRARTKGGVTIVFGNPGNASVSSPDPVKYDATVLIRRSNDNTDHVLAFAESVAIDTAGDFIEFHYKQNGKGDYNIDEALYTGHGSIDDKAIITKDHDPFASVTFLYQDAPWTLESYVSGGPLSKDKILSDVYSCVSDTTISYPFDCKAATTGGSAGAHQTAHYQLNYDPTDTASRLVLKKVRLFGADDATEISPTTFRYTPSTPGWDLATNFLPDALTLASIDHVARGYRFAHVDPASSGGLDLLFAAQVNGKNVAFAFKNGGPASWAPGGQPWTDDGKTDVQTGLPSGFAPPVPFVDESGSDLGVIVADIDGSGRSAILQSDVRANQEAKASYLPGAKQYESHPEYNLPFAVSQDGKVVANYRLAKWTGGVGPDLIYISGDKKGLLKNLGPGPNMGWAPLNIQFPDIALDSRTRLIDLDCSGGPPALVGPNPDGSATWNIFRYTSTGWVSETDPKWQLPFPPDTDPEAVREIRFDGPSSKCAGLIVASAKTNTRLAIVPSPSGWHSVEAKVPTTNFSLVDAKGNPSKAIVVNLKGDGYDGIVAKTLLSDGSTIAFAFTQDSTGWHDTTTTFVPDAALSSLDPIKPVFSFVGPIVGQGGDDIAILNDQQVTSTANEGRNRQFGKFYTNDGGGFVVQTSFAPPIQFATKDKTDTGARFVDLHGTGLPDVLVSRLATSNGKTYLVSAAYRNTGHGWVPEPGDCTDPTQSFDTSKTDIPTKNGLCPSVPFSGADITGNPTQFLDLDGDGYVDMIYSYKDKSGNLVTKIYFNVSDGKGGRAWSDAASNASKFAQFVPPPQLLPLAASGIGDMGVRFLKFDAHNFGVLKSFREGSMQCTPICRPVEGSLDRAAFVFDGTKWNDASANYLPPVPFVTQYTSTTDQSIDLFVQLIDVSGGGLPCIMAYYQDPVTTHWLNHVWTNDGTRWVDSGIQVPTPLDDVYRHSKALVQVVYLNGDGLPDIVRTDGSAPDQSQTWLGTGVGWIDATSDWKIPAEAVSSNDGDPGFRLVDTKGDGYLDILWMRPNENGQPQRGLALNNGHDWKTRRDDVVPADISFADGDGVDQGVRLLSVTGKGVTDIVSSFGGTQESYLNRTRRADVLSSITDGYGIKTSVAYETLLEYDCSDSPTGNDCAHSPSGVQVNPLGWRAYERETPDAYPKIASVPTTYVVRQSVVDEADGKPPIAIDYRYGKYQVDAVASRSLGFGWRESLNEFSKILTRSEMVQDARALPGVAVETSCVVDTSVLASMVAKASASSNPTDRFSTDLCASGDTVASAWGRKISQRNTCWNVVEGDLQAHVDEVQFPATTACARQKSATNAALSGKVVRQSAIWKSLSSSFELDGHVISQSTDTFTYDSSGGILDLHGNVLSTVSALADGSLTETKNEYADDSTHWSLGRLIRAVVTKTGDLIDGGPRRETETRCSEFSYSQVNGLLYAQVANCGTSKPITTRIDRDAFGNIVRKTVSALGERQQITETVFDTFGRYSIAAVDVLGNRSATERNPATGQQTSTTDINGLTTTFLYDGFGRIRSQTKPTGLSGTTDFVTPAALPKYDANHDIGWGLSSPVSYAVKSRVGNLPATWALFDAKGRQLRQVTDGFTSDSSKTRFIFKETEYDSLGRVIRTSVPHEASDPDIRWTTNEYDALGRVCASTAINGLRSETLFTGRAEGGGTVSIVVDPKRQLNGPPVIGGVQPTLSCGKAFPANLYHASGLDQHSWSVVDMRKQTIESRNADGKVTFKYDAGERLEKMVGPTGATTTNTYDNLGNKVAVSDPDLGLWRYEYDPFSRVVKQVDAKGQVAIVEYDVAGRPIRRVAQDVSTTWSYDTAKHGLEKIASVEGSNGYREEYYYDAYGRTSGAAVQIGQEQFFTTTEYDDYDRAARLSYPNGFAVRNAYDKKGYFTEVLDAATSKNYWSAIAIDVLGRVTEEKLGNGIKTVKNYRKADERVHEIYVEDVHGKSVMDLTVDFDLIGNLKERKEAVERKSEEFDYDELNRLTTLVSAEVGRSEYRYDAASRFTSKGGTGDYHYADHPGTMEGDDFKPFHGVIRTSHGPFEEHYRYDRNGNMISMPRGHIDYTADNRVKLLYLDQDQWSRIDYGPTGDRFRRFSRVNSDTEETLYVGLYERVIEYGLSVSADHLYSSKFSQFARLVRTRNYIKNGSGIFAVVETDDTYSNTELFHPPSLWYGKLSTTETWYMHADQLGSLLRVTDQDGRIRERFWYNPWGVRTISENNQTGPDESQQIAGSWKRGFVGQEHLDDFSLIHLNGRMYNPILGVFTSVDPVNQMTSDPQSGNGYVYTRGNPLRYVDPSGYDFFSDVGNFVSGVVGGIGQAFGAAWNGVSHFLGEAGKWLGENWRMVVVVAVVIVVEVVTVGAATPAVGAVAAGILGGMAAGAVGGALGAALYGGSPDDIIAAAIKGAVIGGISGAASAGVTGYFGAAGAQATTASEVESIAAHGAIAGGRQALEGGNFWTGLETGLVVAAVDTYGPQDLNRTENVAKSSLIGGTTAAINGGKFANGAIMGAFSADFRDWVQGYSSIIGKIWALPNSAIGLAIGAVEFSVGLGVGLLGGDFASVSFANNSLQVLNAPIGFGGAITFGNVEIFNSAAPDTTGCRYGFDLDCEFEGRYTPENSVTIGPHEEGHTYQYERIGPLFLPAYVLFGGISEKNPFEQSADNYGRNTGGPFSAFH